MIFESIILEQNDSINKSFLKQICNNTKKYICGKDIDFKYGIGKYGQELKCRIINVGIIKNNLRAKIKILSTNYKKYKEFNDGMIRLEIAPKGYDENGTEFSAHICRLALI